MTTRTKILLIACLSAAFIACKKGESPAPSNSGAANQDKSTGTVSANPVSATSAAQINGALIGTWKMVSDSIAYLGETQALNSLSIYQGTPQDYIEITADGKMTIKENGITCAGIYTASSATQLSVKFSSYFNAFAVGGGSIYAQVRQISLTNNSAEIESELITPGGIFSRKYTLSK